MTPEERTQELQDWADRLVAKATKAETERCAKVARDFPDDCNNTVTGPKIAVAILANKE